MIIRQEDPTYLANIQPRIRPTAYILSTSENTYTYWALTLDTYIILSSLISYVLGGSIRLHCSVTNVEDSGVSWFRLSDYQILTNGLKTFTSDRRFKLLHTPGGHEWTLELVSVTQNDEGGYQCQASKNLLFPIGKGCEQGAVDCS